MLSVKGNKIIEKLDEKESEIFLKGINVPDVLEINRQTDGLWNIDNLLQNITRDFGKPSNINCIRFPIILATYKNFHMGDIFQQINKALDFCSQNEMYLILDFHLCCKWGDKINDCLNFFQIMAERYHSNSRIIFEIFNEPKRKNYLHENDWYYPDHMDMASFVNCLAIPVVRSIRRLCNNIIIVGQPDYCGMLIKQQIYMKKISDSFSGIVGAAHIYPKALRQKHFETRISNIKELSSYMPVLLTETGFGKNSNIERGTEAEQNQILESLFDYISGFTAWCYSPYQNWGPSLVTSLGDLNDAGEFFKEIFENINPYFRNVEDKHKKTKNEDTICLCTHCEKMRSRMEEEKNILHAENLHLRMLIENIKNLIMPEQTQGMQNPERHPEIKKYLKNGL